jgi:SAM-dependent methyltransferase
MADAESMRLNERFDLIVAGELIEHLSNPGLFLERAREHLKEGGRLILTTPNPWDWTRFARAVIRLPSTPIQDHVCWYDKETIRNLANRYGFKVERVEFVPRLPNSGERKVWVAALEKVVCYISWLLYRLGFIRIASMNLFIKCIFDGKEKR